MILSYTLLYWYRFFNQAIYIKFPGACEENLHSHLYLASFNIQVPQEHSSCKKILH